VKKKARRQFFVPKNTYELTGSDVRWIYAHSEDPARDLITGLIKRRFDKQYQRFGTDAKLAKACIAFAKSAKFEFSENSVDKAAWESFVKKKNLEPTARIEAFRLLWRGYSDSDIDRSAKSIRKDLEGFKALLVKALSRNDSLQKRADKVRNSFRVSAYKANRFKLKEVEKTITKAYKTDPTILAQGTLSHRVMLRRKRYPWVAVFPFPGDYLGVRVLLREYDPDLVAFPFRYMTYLPAESYNVIRTMWLKSATREKIIIALAEAEVNSDFSLHDELDKLNGILRKKLCRDRVEALKELRIIYKNECYHATTLLAVTQTEGVLWDFASYLNRRNIRIFKEKKKPRSRVEYCPFEWDMKKNCYKKLNPDTKRPMCTESNSLHTARKLLELTRLGSIISPDFYSYLVDEFYDDRNTLAHGREADRDFKVDAIAARYCLYASMLEVAKYVEKIEV
jgi:hypothetical protein